MEEEISKLQSFRENLHAVFPARGDAIMDLLDALTSYGHNCNSIVKLSKAECYRRGYSSITDAIADGLSSVDWEEIESLVYRYLSGGGEKRYNKFLVDCTGNPRQYARTLIDKTITHSPNPAPGNRPICVGHQYSLLALLPNELNAEEKHWIVPLSMKRVKSDEKGNEIGMHQVIDKIDQLGLSNELSVSIGDSLYGTLNCRIKASEQDNLIHIFRVSSKRNLYYQPDRQARAGAGRELEFGEKMMLNDASTHRAPDIEKQTTWRSRKNKEYQVTISCWQDVLFRGSRKYRSSKYPVNLIKICVEDENGKMLYKKPLWLAVYGKRRNEISVIECYKSYASRYDIEHFFRFGKGKLLMTAYQTPDLEHEELWLKFCLLAYAQLYLSKNVAPSIPEPWERYLPQYKSTNSQEKQTATPSQTQRGFHKILDQIGSPAASCVARGKSCGRILGTVLEKRKEAPIIIKGQNSAQKTAEAILFGLRALPVYSNSKRITQLLRDFRLLAKKLKIPTAALAKMIADSC